MAVLRVDLLTRLMWVHGCVLRVDLLTRLRWVQITNLMLHYMILCLYSFLPLIWVVDEF